MSAKPPEKFPRTGDTAQEHSCGPKWRAGSKVLVQTRLFCNPIGQPKAVWACNVHSAGELLGDQQDEAGGELFREFAVAPEDIFGDDVHIPDIAEEEVEDNGFVFDQAAQQSKDSPVRTTSSLTFGWWHTQQDKDADSISMGREERPSAHGDGTMDEATAGAIPRSPHGNSAGSVQSGGKGDAGQRDEGELPAGRGNALLEPLPGSPGGLASADLLDNEIPTAPAPDVHPRPADAMPLTQAPDMRMGPSQDAFASQITPEKGPHHSSGDHGAGCSQASAQKTTMFGKGLRAVLSPFRGIFGDKGKGNSQKGSSQAEGSRPEAGISQHKSTVPATPLSSSQGGTGTMASLASSPKGAPVRQGLEFIEYAHRLGGAKLKLASAGGPPSGPGEGAASASAAPGSTDAPPLGVDGAGGPVTATADVAGQSVGAEAAKEAVSHQNVAPSGVPAEEDCIAVAPNLAPEAAAERQAPSRKRMQPGADAPGATSGEAHAEGAAVGAPENQPRKQKRRLATGMDVVRRIFGFKDPEAPQAPIG